MMYFTHEINETPCVIHVTCFEPAIDGEFFGKWEDCYPAQPCYIEFEVLVDDLPAKELENSLTEKDRQELEELIESRFNNIEFQEEF